MDDRNFKSRRSPIAPYPNVFPLSIQRRVLMTVGFALAGALGFVVGAFVFSATVSKVFGAERSPAIHGSCGPSFRETLYFARFELGGAKSIQIGRSHQEDGRPATLALIKNARTGSCDAVCEVQSLEMIDSITPTAMQLNCRDTALGAVQTPATLLWARTSPLAFPALRFGSWLSGYQHAKLMVEVDTYSQRRPISVRILRKYAQN